MQAIIGSGFGLYGHLPAMVKNDSDLICIPMRYKSKFQTRHELLHLEKYIYWSEDDSDLSKVEKIVIAIWPSGQEKCIEKCLSYQNITSFILEKPLGVSPENSRLLLNKLISSKKVFRINYSFLYTNWFEEISNLLTKKNIESVEIEWNFFAHHFKNNLNNWKRYKTEGGGIIRFYGIHLIAVLVKLNYSRIINSKTIGLCVNEESKWEATFERGDKVLLKLVIDSKNSDDSFVIKLNYNKEHQHEIKLKDPFSDLEVLNSNLDPRVAVIEKIHKSLNISSENQSMNVLYENINKLWYEIENKNHFSESKY